MHVHMHIYMYIYNVHAFDTYKFFFIIPSLFHYMCGDNYTKKHKHTTYMSCMLCVCISLLPCLLHSCFSRHHFLRYQVSVFPLPPSPSLTLLHPIHRICICMYTYNFAIPLFITCHSLCLLLSSAAHTQTAALPLNGLAPVCRVS